MSQHPSLKTSKAGRKLRSVLKRYEKFFALKEKGIIKDDASIFGLPKFKIVRTKIKKDKAEDEPKEGEVAATETAATGKEAAPKADKEKKAKGK